MKSDRHPSPNTNRESAVSFAIVAHAEPMGLVILWLDLTEIKGSYCHRQGLPLKYHEVNLLRQEETNMGKEIFAERNDALENMFFRDGQVRDQLRTSDPTAAMEMLSGIKDKAVLNKLVDLGIRADTLTALAVIPLVLVAWADGVLDADERKAILAGAEAQGIYPGSSGYLLLAGWLEEQPGEALFATWSEYIVTLRQNLSSEETDSLRGDLVGQALKVAEASGGFVGIGSVSEPEKVVLAKLEGVFSA